jgi:hypothetical protein
LKPGISLEEFENIQKSNDYQYNILFTNGNALVMEAHFRRVPRPQEDTQLVNRDVEYIYELCTKEEGTCKDGFVLYMFASNELVDFCNARPNEFVIFSTKICCKKYQNIIVWYKGNSLKELVSSLP